MLRLPERNPPKSSVAAEHAAGGERGGIGGRGGRQLAVAGLLCLLALAAIPFDFVVVRWLEVHPLRGDVQRTVMLCEFFGFGPTVLLVILTAAALDARGWGVARRLAVLVFGAGFLANVIKALVARQRPLVADATIPIWDTFAQWLPLIHKTGWSYEFQSFPSGHTATAVGLAVGLAALYPRGRYLFYFYAVLAGLQRMLAEAHFFSDVLVGAALAVLVDAVLRRLGWSVENA